MNDLVLVVTSVYPKESNVYGGIYIHTRNKYYIEQGYDVRVICFTATEDYIIEGVKVIAPRTYYNNPIKNDIILCHAPDRNILFFLNKYADNFKHIVLFIHGNEVLRRTKYYKKDYCYRKGNSKRERFLSDVRDLVKIETLKLVIRKYKKKIYFVFVSKWMLDEFLCNMRMDLSELGNRYEIIYNCVGDLFEQGQYNYKSFKDIDYITIRGSLDSSKYAIDIVNELAEKNPEYSFVVIGKGKFFEYYPKASNIEWIDDTLNHAEIIKYLQRSKCALMPTRHDAQGVMMCEMATFGIPMITSNITVCHEVLHAFPNVFYIDNDGEREDIGAFLNSIKPVESKIDRYSKDNTCGREIKLLNRLIESK